MMKSPAILKAIILGIAILSLLVAFGPSMLEHVRLSARTYSDDFRIYAAPYLRPLGDGPEDYVARYCLAIQPVGYRAVYTVGSRIWDATQVNRFLPYFLLAFALAAFAFGAAAFGGPVAAWCAVALSLATGAFFFSIGCGLPRSFGIPVMVLAVASAVRGRIWWLALSVVLGAFFYPSVMVAPGLTLAAILLLTPASHRGDAATWSLRKRVLVLGATGAMALAAVLVVAYRTRPYGEAIGPDDFDEYPEATGAGRHRRAHDRVDYDRSVAGCIEHFGGLIYRPHGQTWAEHIGGKAWSEPARRWLKDKDNARAARRVLRVLLLLGGTAAVISGQAGRRLLLFSVLSVGAYMLARACSPYFFMPQRQPQFAFPVLSLFWLIAAAASAPKVLGFLLKSWRAALASPVARSVSLLAISLTVILLTGSRIDPREGRRWALQTQNKFYEFVRNLPEDAYIAGWPPLMMSTTHETRRRVFVSLHTHLPFHTEFVEEKRERTVALIDAYYAHDVCPLLRLRDEHGVTHLAIYTPHLRSAKPNTYMEPFNDHIRRRFEEANGSFEARRQRKHAEVFSWGKLYVLDLSKLVVGTNVTCVSEM